MTRRDKTRSYFVNIAPLHLDIGKGAGMRYVKLQEARGDAATQRAFGIA